MKKRITILLSIASLILSQKMISQVGIGTSTPNGALEINSSNSGVIVPNIALTSRATSSPVTNPNGGSLTTGTLVWNTATTSLGTTNDVLPGFYYWDGSAWIALAGNNGKDWSTTGNAGTSATTNFIGTTDAQPFRTLTNNTERLRVASTGETIYGATSSPYSGDILTAVGTSALPFGINGYSAQNGSGVWGETLAASSSAFSSVNGTYGGTGNGSGILGNYNGTNTSTTRAGVYGVCSAPANTGGIGVYGYVNITSGNQHIGVLGQYNGSSYGLGVYGIAYGGGILTGNNDIAVVGWRANNANYSGYFNGNHVISNGTKSASVGTSKGNQLLYVTETPEVWFEDIGGSQLIHGTAHIRLDEMFLETVFVDETHPMRIFLQEEGESNGLIVIKDADNKGFTVKEKNNGVSTISFSYRIMAKRLHFQDHRFGNDPVWGAGDTRKYNQYAPPPPVDYDANVKFQEEQRKNYKPTPLPAGFIPYETLQKEAKEKQVTR